MGGARVEGGERESGGRYRTRTDDLFRVNSWHAHRRGSREASDARNCLDRVDSGRERLHCTSLDFFTPCGFFVGACVHGGRVADTENFLVTHRVAQLASLD